MGGSKTQVGKQTKSMIRFCSEAAIEIEVAIDWYLPIL